MKKIILNHFRCFSRLEVDLKPGINLLIGDNAGGKTTLLKAIRAAMSTFFAGYSDDNTSFIGLQKDDFSLRLSGENTLANEQPVSLSFDYSDYIQYSEYHTSASPSQMIATMAKDSIKGRTLVKGIESFKNYSSRMFKELFDAETNTQTKALPLFASFSTEDIHSLRKIQGDKFKKYEHKPSFGYYECLQGDGFFPYWIKRLLVLAEGDKNISERQIVRQAIQTALGENGCNIINDMMIRPLQGKVYYRFTDGREIESEQLSDGYRRLVHIVTDLAFRCSLLNQTIYGEDACIRTIGSVLIDEIDLHLHPKLQSRVLQSLRLAFPRIQFIVSSHAPMVMTGVESSEENVVYKLSYNSEQAYQIDTIQTYGQDASTIIMSALDTLDRNEKTKEELATLFSLIDDDKNREAQGLIKSLREKYNSTIPELSRAEALLAFNLSGNEED